MTPTERGFTLIELLVVISIMSILMGMALPSLSLIRKFGREAETRGAMGRVDTALRLFRSDWGVYPAQHTYPQLAGGTGYDNRLFYHLGTDIAPVDRTNILADADRAAAKFNYVRGGSQPSSLTYTPAVMEDVVQDKRDVCAALANRMAMEQVRLALLAGITDQRGPVISDDAGNVVADKRGSRVLAGGEAASETNPGWASDYLGGDIAPHLVDGERVLDAWGRPLIYICRVIPGIQGTSARIYGALTTVTDHKRFGMGPIGFDPTLGPGPQLAASRPLLLYNGRVRLSPTDAGDGLPTPSHSSYLPDAGDLMGSDLRYYAAPGFEDEFELWSAGPRGQFDYRRDHEVNRDNIAAGDYLRGIGDG